MRILSDKHKEWLRTYPRWSDGTCGEQIIDRCAEVEREYEFDVAIPMAEQREHIDRLQEELRQRERREKSLKVLFNAPDAVLPDEIELSAQGGEVLARYRMYCEIGSPFSCPELEEVGSGLSWDGDSNFILSSGVCVFLIFAGIALLIFALAYAT